MWLARERSNFRPALLSRLGGFGGGSPSADSERSQLDANQRFERAPRDTFVDGLMHGRMLCQASPALSMEIEFWPR